MAAVTILLLRLRRLFPGTSLIGGSLISLLFIGLFVYLKSMGFLPCYLGSTVNSNRIIVHFFLRHGGFSF